MALSTWFEFVSHTRYDTGAGPTKQDVIPPKDSKGAPAAKGVFLTAEGGIAIITLDGNDPVAASPALRIPDGGVPFFFAVADRTMEVNGAVANVKLHATWVK